MQELIETVIAEPETRTIGALSARLGVDKSLVSRRVSRLVELGLLRRDPDPRSRRGIVPNTAPASAATPAPGQDQVRRGLARREAELAAVITQEPGPHTVSDLAARFGVTKSRISQLLDRLCAAGLACREPNPVDRRSVLVRPTHRTAGMLAQSGRLAATDEAERQPGPSGSNACSPSERQMELLLGLAAASRPVNESRLAAEFGVSTAAICTMVRRLKAAGLLEKTRDPADARSMLITLTPSGLQQVCEFVRRFRLTRADQPHLTA